MYKNDQGLILSNRRDGGLAESTEGELCREVLRMWLLGWLLRGSVPQFPHLGMRPVYVTGPWWGFYAAVHDHV